MTITTGIVFACLVFATTDGDTLKCRVEPDAAPVSVRLYGVNTPERGEQGYREARESLQALSLRQEIRCEIVGTSHDRLVARCTLPDGEDLSALQVRNGVALDCPAFSGGAYADLETAEQRAKPDAAFCVPKAR